MTTKTILLSDIRIDGGTQARCDIDQGIVAEYAQLMRDDEYELPEPVVFFDGSRYWLADGFHRFFAHQAVGKLNIICEIKKGTKRDAILYSLNANTHHGLRPNNDDKRKAVGTMLADAEWSEMSDRAIARHCGCSRMTVARIRSPEPVIAKPARVTSDSQVPPVAAPASVTSDTPTPKPAQPAPTVQLGGDEGDDPIALLEAAYKETAEVRALLAVAEADDQKAETIKYKRIADVATRRQNELMDTVNAREAELKRLMNTIRRICAAAGEDDPSKIAAVVEAMYRSIKVAA